MIMLSFSELFLKASLSAKTKQRHRDKDEMIADILDELTFLFSIDVLVL